MAIWDAIQAVSGALSTVVVIFACVYAAGQVREAKHTRALHSLVTIHQEYQAEPLRKVRRRLRMGELDAAALGEEDREALEDLLQKLELVAFLVSRRLVALEDVIALFPSVPAIVSKVRPYIDQRRLTEVTYAENALRLAAQYP
ncbi:hypothetical protein ACWGI8_06680 [Streptomyces sp. NPDC054841]